MIVIFNKYEYKIIINNKEKVKSKYFLKFMVSVTIQRENMFPIFRGRGGGSTFLYLMLHLFIHKNGYIG